MKACIITRPGAPDVLQFADRPRPELQAGEVLIRVAAAGVNRPDVSQRKGHYPAPPGVSKDIPGLELAGTVVSLSPECTRFRTGDHVCALVAGGAYAEYCAVPEGQCLPVPEGLSMVEAASLPETFFTVWSNLFDRGHLKPTETVLIHGGSSGIGTAAIQLANATGARVIVTAGSDEKCGYCEGLGASLAINYKTRDFVDAVLSFTEKRGADVILDMVGGDYTPRNIAAMAPEGRLVLINHMSGDQVTVSLNAIMQKRLTLTGSTLRSRTVGFKSTLAQKVELNVWPLLTNRKIRPVIFETFKLNNAAAAHRLMETGSHMGKIVLTMD